MKTPAITSAAAHLLINLCDRPGPVRHERVFSDEESLLSPLVCRKLIDVTIDGITVTTLGHRIAESIYVLWLQAKAQRPEDGYTRALRGLVAEVVGACPAESV